MINCDVKDLTGHSYFGRNRAWLLPLCGAVMSLLLPIILFELKYELPSLLSFLQVVTTWVAFLTAGIGAAITPTLSARLVTLVALVVAVVFALKFVVNELF